MWKICLNTHTITMEDGLLSPHTKHLCLHDSSFEVVIYAYFKNPKHILYILLYTGLLVFNTIFQAILAMAIALSLLQ